MGWRGDGKNGLPSRSSHSERRLVDIEPETWNQLFDTLQNWAVILKNRPNPAFYCERLAGGAYA